MIVSIHQPNLFPWLGFFDKLIRCDLVVLHDSCRSDSKLGWTKRVRIRSGKQSQQWLTIPTIKAHRDGEGRYPRLMEHRLEDFERTRKDHLRRLTAEYRQMPHFEEAMGLMEECYAESTVSLTAFNERSIGLLCGRLELPACFLRASSLDIGSVGNQANADIVKAVGGTVYLSGDGSQGYLDPKAFEKAGIDLLYQSFEHPVYDRTGDTFLPGLSILDALMNLGCEGTRRVLLGAENAASFLV